MKMGRWAMIVLGTFLCCAPSFATPPVSITVSYDMDKELVHIKAVHPSFNLEKSYVRLMEVYLNNDRAALRNYYRQKDYQMFIEDLPLKAKTGDAIKVALFCSLGGDMSQELIVTKLEKE